jgi:hypothetical protein
MKNDALSLGSGRAPLPIAAPDSPEGARAMVFPEINVLKGQLDCAVLAAEGGKPLGRRSFPNDAEG